MESAAPAVPLDQLLVHRAWLRRLARALVGEGQAADDLVQEVWLAAMQRPPQERRSLKGWLATVLRRKAIDRSRAEQRRALYESDSPSPEPGVPADELLAQAELHKRLTDAVLELEEPYRGTLLLRYVGGNTLAEVARLQGVPIETVRTRIKRALARLRTRLDRESAGNRKAWMSVLVPFAWPQRAALLSAGGAATAAAATGGAIVGTKVAMAAAAVAAVGLAVWASAGLMNSDLAPTEHGVETSMLEGEETALVEGTAPALEGNPDARATRTGASRGGTARAAPGSTTRREDRTPVAKRGVPGRIEGRILGVDGEVVPGIAVTVAKRISPNAGQAGPRETQQVSVDENGRFRLDKIPEGSYDLRITAPGFAHRLHVAEAGQEPLAITLEEVVALSGRIVTDDARIVIAGLPLIARSELAPYGGQATFAETDAEGHFIFEGLAPGNYLITFGFQNAAGDQTTAGLVPLRAGPFEAGADDVDVVVRYGGVIAGTLTDGNGNVIADAVRVEALGLTDEDQKDYSRRYFASSKPDGTFEFVGLVFGRYSLAFDPARGVNSKALRGPRTTYVDNVLSGTEDLAVTMLEGIAVHGSVQNEKGEAVTGKGYVQVRPSGTVSGGQQAVVLHVDAEGRFRTPPLDATQTYDVHAGGFSGYTFKNLTAVTPDGEALVIILDGAKRITGRVLDENGAAATSTSVVAYAVGVGVGTKGYRGFTYVGVDGRFELEGLGDFEFRLYAGGSRSGYVTKGAAVLAKAGASDVVLHVRPGVAFAGRIVDQYDLPIRSPHVNVTDGNNVWFTQVTDDEGNFRFAGLPKGTLQISARIGGVFTNLGEIVVPTEGVVTLKVPAPK